MRENNTMIHHLSKIGNTKFNFSQELIRPVLEKYAEDISWIENRLGISFSTQEKINTSVITSEKDLLQINQSIIDELKEIIGGKYLPVGLQGKTSNEIALLVHALRLKVISLYEIHLDKKNNIQNILKNKENLSKINQVLKGKDQYLFLSGGNHQVVKFFTGERKPTIASINNFLSNIENRKIICDKKNIEYKHYIFGDKLFAMKDKTNLNIISLYEKYYKNLNHTNHNITYLNFSTQEYFTRTDTHLNLYGKLKALSTIIEDDNDIANYHKYIQDKLQLVPNFSGDLGKKLDPIEYETNIILKDAKSSIVHHHNGILSGNIGIMDILTNNNALYNKKLLIFGDSFFRSMLQHLSYFYKEIVFCRTPFIHEEVVDNYNPDILFTGNAERYLSNVKNDSNADSFFHIPYKHNLSLNPSKKFNKVFFRIFKFDYLYE